MVIIPAKIGDLFINPEKESIESSPEFSDTAVITAKAAKFVKVYPARYTSMPTGPEVLSVVSLVIAAKPTIT